MNKSPTGWKGSGDVNSYLSGTRDFYLDASQVAEFKWDQASSNSLSVGVLAWYFPAGM